jgi:hypothetical protein
VVLDLDPAADLKKLVVFLDDGYPGRSGEASSFLVVQCFLLHPGHIIAQNGPDVQSEKEKNRPEG